MRPPPRVPNEARRLEALQRYRVLDTIPEQALDDLTALAAHVCDTPISLISIVGEQRQWFKSKLGLSISEVLRDVSFSAHAILQPDLFIVPDATQDARFAENPLVTGDSHFRFYAGAPLTTIEGQAIGTLCVIDRVPRQLTPSQQEALRMLSRQVMAQLELRLRTRELVESEARLQMVTDNAHVGLFMVDHDRRCVYANSAYAGILDLPPSAIGGQRLPDVLAGSYEPHIRPRLDRAFAGERVGHEWSKPTAQGEAFYAVRYEPTYLNGSPAVVVVLTDVTERKEAGVASDRLAAIVESSDDAIISTDLDGIITSWNKGAAAILGYCAAEMAGTSVMELIPDERQDEERRVLEKIARGESVRHLETQRRIKDGRLIDVSVTTSPIRDAAGAVIGASKVARDITARKRAEWEIRRGAKRSAQAEQEFRTLFAGNPLPMWIYELATLRFLEVNEAAVRCYGYDRDEFLSMSIKDIRPPEDVERLRSSVAEPRDAWQGGGRWRHRLKSGAIIDVDITSHTITFVGRSAALVVSQDITERERMEEARRASEERYRTLFEYAPDGIVIADRESYYIDANASMCAMLGYSRDEFIGLHASDIVIPEEIPHIGSALDAITATSDYRREWQFRRKDGSAFTADVIATTMPDGNLLAMIHDVTERKQAVDALRITEERMRFALQSADVGIWDRDFATGALRWSETLEAQYGLAAGTFGGTFEAFIERVHPDDRESLIETMGKATQGGTDFSVLNRALWPDGTVRWLSGQGRILLGADGEPVRGIGISQDVTERRTLEEQFQQAQKMDAVGRLAGGVAHDFNNLLTVILGYCEMLLADVDPDERRQADIAEIQRSATSAAALTRQLLAFSRKQIIEPAVLDLNVVVADMRGMLGRLIREDVHIALALWPEATCVTADRGQIEQIVMNLAVNARDAMPNGGTLTIATAIVERDVDDPAAPHDMTSGPCVRLTVSDTGTGMTPQVQARLFEPFFTTKDVGRGTGLGLATVHGIVLRSGGTISVDSDVGKGTSFTVYFPRVDAVEAVAAAPPPVPRPPPGGQTVLVVDDIAGLLALAKRLLERQGYTVLLAANADEALRLFETHPSIDVLLTDVVMPGASGPELTRQLVEQRPNLKVIYMSGYTEDAIVDHGVLNPGIAFLHKPFTADSLGQKIRDVLDR